MADTDIIAYLPGYYLGAPLLIGVIVYIVIRVAKKRRPTKKEWIAITLVVVGLIVLQIATKAAKAQING